MGPKTKALIEVLNQLVSILQEDRKDHWAQWMQQGKDRLLVQDASGIEKVLNAYGGMGSFNDVCLSKITSKNSNFSRLQSEAWELALEIKNEIEANT